VQPALPMRYRGSGNANRLGNVRLRKPQQFPLPAKPAAKIPHVVRIRHRVNLPAPSTQESIPARYSSLALAAAQGACIAL
jgi:hypothetical protein